MACDDSEYQELLTNPERDSLDSDELHSPSPEVELQPISRMRRWFTRSPKPKSKTFSDNDPLRRKERISPLLLWLAAAIVLVACTDLIALAYITRMFDTVYQDTDFASNLEYADPYIGLKELYESGKVNSSKIERLVIRPRVSAQVFVDEPDRSAPRGERDYWSETWGTLSPNERHLYVTPKVNTIVQFRAIDFGMEACHIVFTLPKLGATLEDHASFAMHPSSRFDVFRLAAPRPVDVKTLSYRTRPARAEKVATLQAREDDDTVIHRFSCPRASLHVFEIACAQDEECLLDVWSSQNTTYGVNMHQHQTV